MDPDRVGTLGKPANPPATRRFQFIWIPTESGLYFILWIFNCFNVFPIYMDPDRVGTAKTLADCQAAIKFPIYMDPDRVGTHMLLVDYISLGMFPIYMDPDRVGTHKWLHFEKGGNAFPIYMDPDRVGT